MFEIDMIFDMFHSHSEWKSKNYVIISCTHIACDVMRVQHVFNNFYIAYRKKNYFFSIKCFLSVDHVAHFL